MSRDIFKEAYGAMRHDLRKTLLTMLGMAWGIATVVLLLAYGEGFGRAIQNIWDSYGATAVGIYPGRTSQQAGGTKAGAAIRFTNPDTAGRSFLEGLLGPWRNSIGVLLEAAE